MYYALVLFGLAYMIVGIIVAYRHIAEVAEEFHGHPQPLLFWFLTFVFIFPTFFGIIFLMWPACLYIDRRRKRGIKKA